MTKTHLDLYEAGIVDHANVLRITLENSVAVASVLLLTEGTVAELPGKKPAALHLPEE